MKWIWELFFKVAGTDELRKIESAMSFEKWTNARENLKSHLEADDLNLPDKAIIIDAVIVGKLSCR